MLACSPSERAIRTPPNTAVTKDMAAALERDSAQDALDFINQLLADNSVATATGRGNLLAIMRTMDFVFCRIHPRDDLEPNHRLHIPVWLKNLRDQHRIQGYYSATADYRLIQRGPLLRTPREENAANADSLADRFTALAVVELKQKQHGRTITIQHKVIGTDAARGVAPGSKTGHEVVVFIPIAEAKEHLTAIKYSIGEQQFVDFQINSINPADYLLAALSQAPAADIAIAPEMVMMETHADELTQKLLNRHGSRPRLLIAGSGATTVAKSEGLPWNEARVVNSIGHELWRQRKIWPAGLNRQQAKKYQLSDVGSSKQMLEYNAAGHEIIIVDAGSLGRCVVLTCQDLKADPVVSEIIRQFQPDWVFSPILDPGINTGGWVHQRVLELSDISQARFLVASSTALGQWLKQPQSLACGFAHGPKASTTEDRGRRYTLAYVADNTSPGYAVITWRSKEGWFLSTLSGEAEKNPDL